MDKVTATIIKTYDETADQFYYNNREGKSVKRIIDKYSKLLTKGAKILDAGCGPGRDAKWLTDKGFNVVGIDLSKNMIRLARKHAPKAIFKIMDLRELDFPNNSFDAIWFNSSVLCIRKADALRALSEMCRVLREKGYLYINTKKGKGEGFVADMRYGGRKKFYAFYETEEIIDLLNKAGFRIIESSEKYDENINMSRIEIYCRKA